MGGVGQPTFSKQFGELNDKLDKVLEKLEAIEKMLEKSEGKCLDGFTPTEGQF